MDDLDDFLAEMEAAERRGEAESTRTLPRAPRSTSAAAAADDAMSDVGDTSAAEAAPADHASLTTAQLEQLLATIRELEAQLKQATQQANASTTAASSLQVPSSKHLAFAQQKNLRKHLRAAYLRYIDASLASAVQHEMEASLWKLTVYRQIEAFRKLLKQLLPHHAGDKPSTKSDKQWTRYLQFSTLTLSFIRECERTYERLFMQHLRHTGWEAVPAAKKTSKSGESAAALGEDVEMELQPSDAGASSSSSSSLRLPYITLRPVSLLSSASSAIVLPAYESRALYLASCHRCLIFRGDLQRYWQTLKQEEEQQKSKRAAASGSVTSGEAALFSSFKPRWSRVSRCYFLAVTLLPQLGQPWNQLAVLATYEHDTLLAVYRYFRALSAVTPFPTAEVNLKLLFENTIDSTVYASHAVKHAASTTLTSPLFPGAQVCTHFMLTPWLDFGWVHCFHLLSSKHHPQLQAALPCVANAVLMRFSQQMKSGATLHSEFALRILLNFIYCAHRPDDQPHSGASSRGGPQSHSTHGDVQPISAPIGALSICCEFLNLLLTTLHTGAAPSLGVISTFLRWLQLHPTMVASLVRTVPEGVRQALFHNLAQVANVAAAHLAAGPSQLCHVTSAETLHEEREILGVAFFTDASSNPLVDSAEPEPSEFRPDVRRCRRLVDLMQAMVNLKIGLVRENGGRFRSLLDPAEIHVQPAASAAASGASRSAPLASWTSAAEAAALHGAQLAAVFTRVQSNHANGSSSLSSSHRLHLPTSAPIGSHLLPRAVHRPPPGFAQLD
jgi:hypothetical protein